MQHTYNSVELVNRWVDLTRTPEKEVRQRVRVLRLAGMLPDGRIERQEALTDEQITTFLIASLASEQHLGAPDKAKEYAALPAEQINSQTFLDGKTFGEALIELVRRSRNPKETSRLGMLQVNATHPFAEIWLHTGPSTAVALMYGTHPSQSGMLHLTTIRQLDGHILADLARKPKDSRK